MKLVTENKKVIFNYHILERIEAGIVLTGDEVKSLRAKHASLIGSFAQVHDGQLMLINANIPPYSHAYQKRDDLATRSRVLLVHKKELMRLIGDVSRKGITLVPTKIYFNDKNLAKVEIGIAKHKNATDKRHEIKERDIKREMANEARGKY